MSFITRLFLRRKTVGEDTASPVVIQNEHAALEAEVKRLNEELGKQAAQFEAFLVKLKDAKFACPNCGSYHGTVNLNIEP